MSDIEKTLNPEEKKQVEKATRAIELAAGRRRGPCRHHRQQQHSQHRQGREERVLVRQACPVCPRELAHLLVSLSFHAGVAKRNALDRA